MATASLGRLTLDLVAQIGQFVEPMNKAERKAKESTDKMNKAFSNFKDQMNQALGGTQLGTFVTDLTGKLGVFEGGVLTATAALAGMAVGGSVVAMGGLAAMTIEVAKADAQMAILANRANISTTNFQILSYAADLLGVSQDGLGQTFADVQEKLGEFSATAGGEASDFFDALKNNTKMTDDQIKAFGKTLQGKDGVEAVQIIKDKLDELGATSQEQRFVFESLGNDLGNLMPLFADGGKLLGEYGAALEDAGVIKTEEVIRQSQMLNAQTQAVSIQFQGWKNQLVTGFMPAMVDVANAIFGTSKNGLQLQDVGAGIGSVLKAVTKVALGVSAAFTISGKLIGGTAAAIAALKGDKIATINMMFDDIGDTLEDYGRRIDAVSITSDAASTSSSELVNSIYAVNTAANESARGLAIDTKAAEENAKAAEEQAKAKAKLKKEQAELNKMVGASALSGLRIKSSESFAGGNVRAYTANFAEMAQSALGDSLTRFTAFNDAYHKGTNSKHATGNAFDFTIEDAKQSEQAVSQLEALAKRYGFVVKVLDEYKNPSSRATGGHIHVSVLGYKGSAGALKEANAELDIVKKTNDEASRIRKERNRQQFNVSSRYATEEQKMAADNEQKIQDIQLAFAGDQTAIDKYLKLQADAYQKDVKAYQAAQKEKYDSTKNDLLDQMANAEDAIALSGIASKYGKNSAQYQNASLDVSSKRSKSSEFDNYTNTVNQINKDYDGPDEAQKRYELLELAYSAHLEKMNALDAERNASVKQLAFDQYQQQLDMWQGLLSNGQNTFSQLTQSVKDSAGEQSGAYRTMFAMQQAFSVASSVVAAWTAYTQAFADPSAMTLPQKFAGGMAVMTALVPALATISSMAIQGFATGGHITGKGTGTSDEIPIMASNGEYMMKAAAVAKLGLGNLDYMNATGNIPGKFAEGGPILDMSKLDNPRMVSTPKYLGGPQVTQPSVNLNPHFVIVDERQSLSDYLFSPDGTKAFVKFFKRNRAALGAP